MEKGWRQATVRLRQPANQMALILADSQPVDTLSVNVSGPDNASRGSPFICLSRQASDRLSASAVLENDLCGIYAKSIAYEGRHSATTLFISFLIQLLV
jgi:hypothetical protein